MEDLMVVATRLFNRHGVVATRMEELAIAAEMTPGNLYNYVGSKEELAYLCYVRSCEIRRTQLDVALEGSKSGSDRIETFFHEQLKGGKGRTAILSEVGALKPDWAQQIRKLQSNNLERLRTIITEGMSDGSLRKDDPFLTSIGVLGIVEWLSFWFSTRLPYSAQEVIELMLDITMKGVTARPPYLVDAVRIIDQDYSTSTLPDPFNKTELGELKLQRFLRVAMDSFNRNGVKATSIDQLCQQLNVTKGAFYHYFNSKEDLLFRCYERGVQFSKNVIPVKSVDANEHEVLVRRALFERHVSEVGPFPVYSNIGALEAPQQREIMKQLDASVDSDVRRIERAVEANHFRNIDCFIAEKVRAGLINWFPIWFTPGHYGPAQVADNHSAIFLNGIAH
ncbi:MAG: TetR family transcriptional regulator [Pseudomonadota bacterium]